MSVLFINLIEAIKMSNVDIKSTTRWALWLAVAIMLVPLVPYALRGQPPQTPVQTGDAAPTMVAPTPAT
ncbi:MAG TPA: hypothetical protein VES73_10365 [Lamprocystis sp. (in: g-proteobacteria)]|nr:hypothetical protein [Lamprocystis sp. (in: g-proteobacteria)]